MRETLERSVPKNNPITLTLLLAFLLSPLALALPPHGA